MDYTNLKLEGYQGPFINKYLKGISFGTGLKKSKDLQEIIRYANDNDMCGGITLTRNGFFTLRRKGNLYNSDPQNKFKSKEITWKKIELTNKTPNKSKLNEVSLVEKLKLSNGKEVYYNSLTRELLDDTGIIGMLKRGKVVLQ
jgi:hypothetical protein